MRLAVFPRRFVNLAFAAATLATSGAIFTATAPTTFAADDPIVAFETSATMGEAPLEVQFSATSSEEAAWSWDFGDGATASTKDVGHSYAAAGTFTVQLTVSYPEHAPVVVTKTDLIVVTAPPPPPPGGPKAGFVVGGAGHFVGQAVAFTDTSLGDPTSWTWSFGDGETATVQSPSHGYALPGVYIVSLTVDNGSGVDVVSGRVTVIGPWSGGVQLYRRGIYSKQATMHHCVAASTQMILNIVAGTNDHSTANQRLYFAYGRAHNGYPIPMRDGIDPAGWRSILQRWVDPGYHIVASRTYAGALRAAALAMRITGRPVGLVVGHGSHVWVLSGFTATADPATSATFNVSSVNVEGSLWGRQSRNGFDQVPNVRISTARFRRFLTPYRDRYEPHAWRNRFVILAP